jgi:hypothetical protein
LILSYVLSYLDKGANLGYFNFRLFSHHIFTEPLPLKLIFGVNWNFCGWTEEGLNKKFRDPRSTSRPKQFSEEAF